MIDLIHGDCLVEMSNIADKSVDMILCDLPYGTTACKWDVVIPFEPLWGHYKRVIKENGAIVLFGSEPFSSHLRMSNLKMYKYDWVWDTVNKITNHLNAKKQPMRKHENISVFYDKQSTYSPIMRTNEESYVSRKTKCLQSEVFGKVTKTDVGRIITEKFPVSILLFKGAETNRRLHPTQKPVSLLEYLIKTYTSENEIVLDNCMGSGSTGVACKNLSRKFIGIEKELKYFEIAKKRIEECNA